MQPLSHLRALAIPFIRSIPRRLVALVPLYLMWLATAALTVVLLWPTLWVDAANVISRYIGEIIFNGGRPNGDGQFFG